MSKKITLVTALFNIGRDNINEFSRSFDHYLECFSKLLKLDYPMVIYCDAETEEFVRKHRKDSNTKIIRKTLDDLRAMPFYDNIQKIRTDQKWRGQAGWIPNSPQSSLELYNPLVMSKQFFLNDAALFNFFNTKYFAWIDAGLANTVDLNSYFSAKGFDTKLTQEMNKMLYVCFPYDGQVEVHGFTKSAMNEYAGTDTKFVARGGFFGGTKEAINEINGLYYSTCNDTLSAGYMGTEESIFTLLCYRNSDLVNIRMIEMNGLIYKFFEDVKNKTVVKYDGNGKVAIYALTYNLPKQFELWAESFKRAFPDEFSKYKKYVLNNSNDPSVEKEYNKLFKKYDFIEFKYDNIGINDGRQVIAEHFDASDEEFMVFFEDDMLLNDKESLGKPCKSGFCTYTENLFDKCADIIKKESLDYLKLSFSEFFGDNHINWAWYNLPQHKKDEYFEKYEDGTYNKHTRIFYTDTLKNVPYAVGEYHYCNWPIMFTKEGSRKVFLDIQYEHKYEQTWMSQTMMFMREDHIKAGSLLLSPITHNRAYHYDGKKRRENKHYKN